MSKRSGMKSKDEKELALPEISEMEARLSKASKIQKPEEYLRMRERASKVEKPLEETQDFKGIREKIVIREFVGGIKEEARKLRISLA